MYRIKKFKVMRVALISTIYGVIVVLLLGIVAAIVFLFVSSGITELYSGVVGSFGSPLLSIVLFPVFYGIAGFIGGLIGALILNLSLKLGKGIDFELEAVATTEKARPKPAPSPAQPPAQPPAYKPAPPQNPTSGYEY